MFNLKLTTLLAGLLALSLYTANADSVTDRFTITVRGTGPDVILVPGLGCSPAVWEATAAHLEAHYRLHLVQLAGFGGLPAQANAKGPIIQPVVDALDAYIKTNQLKTPYFIGHSLGGLTGLMLVQQHPEDIGKLMIVDSLPFFGVLFGAKDAAAAGACRTVARVAARAAHAAIVELQYEGGVVIVGESGDGCACLACNAI